MGFFKNFRKEFYRIINTDNTYSESVKLSFLMCTLLGVHVILLIFFILLKNVPLSIYNSASIVLYFIFRKQILQKRFTLTFFYSCLEIICCTMISTLLLGWNYGFQLYCPAMISVFFYVTFSIKEFNQRSRYPFIFSLVSFTIFLFLYVICECYPPIYDYSDSILVTVIYLFNSIVFYLMMITFSLLFMWKIKNSYDVLQQSNALLSEVANKDPLTQLMNRRSMNQYLVDAMNMLKSSGTLFCVILGDIDDFKKVNDCYGHDCGDLVLIGVANVISNNAENLGHVCRWGGEEILIIINGNISAASKLADKIRGEIENMNLTYQDTPIHITMTFGVAESIPGYKIEKLIQQADDKLYYGKEHGKNQVVI